MDIKNELLTALFHRINTPLYYLISTAETTAEHADLSPEIQRQLNLIQHCGQDVMTRLSHFFTFLKQQQLDSHFSPISLRELVEIVLILAKPAAEKQIQLVNALARDLPLVLADEHCLQHILSQLLQHLIQLTDNVRIEISADAVEEQQLTLVITVSGEAISLPALKEELAVLTQLQPEQHCHGSALELTLTRKLIESQGGHIQFTTDPCVQLSLNLPVFTAQPPLPTALQQPLKQPQCQTTKGLVLIADDDPISLQVLTNYLLNEQFSVIQAADSQTVLAQLDTDIQVDLILLDSLMPTVNGLELSQQLRQQGHAEPIILLATKEQLLALLPLLEKTPPVNGYLTKPILKQEFLACIHSYVQLRRLQQQQVQQQWTETQLRQLSRAVEQSANTILITDLAGNIEFVNPAFSTKSGYRPEEALGQNPRLLKSGRQSQAVYRDLWTTITQGAVWQGELLNKRKNGELYWEFVTISPIRDAQGHTSHYLAIKEDITERKRMESALRQNKQQETQLAQLGQITQQLLKMPIILSRIDEQGRFTESRGAGLAALNLKENQVVGENAFNVYPELSDYIEHALRGETQRFRSLGRNQGKIWAFDNFLTFDHISGQGALGISVDISEQIQAEQALRKHEQFRRTLIQEALIGMVLMRLDGTLVEINPAAAAIIGELPENLINKSCWGFLPRQFAQPWRYVLITLKRYKRFGPEEIELTHRKGNRVPVRLSSLLIEQGGQHFIWSNIENITLQKQHEKVLHQAIKTAETANQAKSRFLANMSHEMRTPLQAILGFTEILQTQVQDYLQAEYLTTIHTSGKALLNLINDILDLSKVEAGKLTLANTEVMLEVLFKEIGQIFSKKIQDKDLKFQLKWAADLPPVLILDETRLRQILLNLVGNAIKFTEQGCVTLEAQAIWQTADCIDLICMVIDEGIGIPESQQSIIFDAFEQLFAPEQNRYGGTGLGLTITKRLVEMMGGSIELKSQVNRGSQFKITFKQVKVATQLSDSLEKNIDLASICFQGAQIFIADDVDSNRQVLKDFLSHYPQLSCVEAQNGLELIELVNKNRPDVILMDIKMPVMNGWQVIELIKQDKKLVSIPIIAITASAMKDSEKQLNLLCDGVLKKPFSKTELIFELTRFLKYTIAEPAPTATMMSPTLATEIFAHLPQLAQRLEQETQVQWQQVSHTLTINEIEQFAEQVKALGQNYHYPPLIHWGQQLLIQSNLFDIQALSKLLAEFPK
ncbi:MAG: PAS domain S-box protein, partial [Pseudomonadota bacterium]|nr:PAS domain S-box protein [Pseudomonadota bacterium]